MSVLEPSAGEGKIVKYIEENYSFENVRYDMVELNKVKVDHMISLGRPNWNVVRGDFLNTSLPQFNYDRIVACPPFKNNEDTVHIMKMYRLLKRKGIIVSLTSPRWVVDNEPHQVEFRSWLSSKEYTFRMLPDNSFVEKHRTVPTAILQIFK